MGLVLKPTLCVYTTVPLDWNKLRVVPYPMPNSIGIDGGSSGGNVQIYRWQPTTSHWWQVVLGIEPSSQSLHQSFKFPSMLESS